MNKRWCILVLLFGIEHARADEFDNLKQSVRLRTDEVEELKRDGVFSEGKSGLLEGMSVNDPAQQKILEAENADRTRLFQLISQRCRTEPVKVASAFARMAGAENGKVPIRFDQTLALPLKVLTRPFANIYSAASDQAKKVRENTPAFTAYFVYQKTKDWYEVGSDNHGTTVGWMRAEDVLEWKHNLVVEFTHPEGRQPVLMFGNKEALSQLVADPRATREPKVQALYNRIKIDSNLPVDFPVRTMEPRRGVPRISGQNPDQFYLLPIIGFEEAEIDNRPSTLLQLAAATRKRGVVQIDDQSFDLRSVTASGVTVDIVFVMDLTKSMGPFAEATHRMITRCTDRLTTDQKLSETLRFGFWGYRDFPEFCHGIEFNTRNYTPELERLPDFERTLGEVQETEVDSIDYEEDVFAGVADAIQKTQWRPDALHTLILIGDAPGRGPKESDPYCTVKQRPIGTKSGMNAETIRHLADEKKVYVSAFYLKTQPGWVRKYAKAGEKQFRTFSLNPGLQPGKENFRFVNAHDTAQYEANAQSLADGILAMIQAAQEGQPPPEPKPVEVEEDPDAGRDLALKMFRGAMVQWLARKDPATVPRDVTVWASDKDLIDPAIQSLDVQVFLTKNELNSLKVMLDLVLDTGIHGKITGEDFIQALRAVVATTTTDPSRIRNAEMFAKTGLVPDFLKGLPYQSRVMGMSNESWSNMSPDAQDQFLREIDSKLRFYQEIHDSSDKWQPLNEGDDRDDWVANVPLEELP